MDEALIRKLEIREAERSDLPRVLPILGQLGMDDGRVLDADEAGFLFEKMLRYPDYRLYVAAVDEFAVGIFALLVMDNLGHRGTPSAIVEDVVVREGWRGKGIGTAMMRYAMALCGEKGCYKMVLSSSRNRSDAHRFYRSLGFDTHGYSFEVKVR